MGASSLGAVIGLLLEVPDVHISNGPPLDRRKDKELKKVAIRGKNENKKKQKEEKSQSTLTCKVD